MRFQPREEEQQQQQEQEQALFRPSGPLCFPVREDAFSGEEEQQQQQEQQEGCRSHCTNSGIKIENHKTLSKTIVFLGFQRDRFWCCSVLQGHCVSLSGRVRFQPREEEQQQQQEQQEGSMSHCTNSGIKNWSKTIQPCPKQEGCMSHCTNSGIKICRKP